MLRLLYLFLVASATLALNKPLHTFHEEKYELLKEFAEKGTDGNLAEMLIEIILEQRTAIKAMEKNMNSLTETVKEKGSQIMEMKEQITHMKTIMEKQNEDINDLEHEKDVLHETIKSQRVEMDSIEKDMMTIIEAIHTEEDGNLTKHPKGGKGNENGNSNKKSSTIANNMLVTGIKRHSKNNSNEAANEKDDRVLANDKGIHNMLNHNYVVLHKTGQQHTALRPGLHRIQNRAATHVAFSSYLTQYL